jgi:hypothetical protein
MTTGIAVKHETSLGTATATAGTRVRPGSATW